MTEQELLTKMIAPGQRRPNKPYREGVIQIHVTRACDKSCFCCTQGSNLGGQNYFMSPEHFKQAVDSLKGYFGVVGVFGGNPATSQHFVEYCRILRESWVPFEQRGLWCNNPITMEKGAAMRETFDPSISNLNVHLDAEAYSRFRIWWPESQPVGLHQDSRHSPPYVAMKDVLKKPCPNCGPPFQGDGRGCSICKDERFIYDEDRIRELISGCDINQNWSAMIGVFRGELRAWFCEVAGAQAILHQHEPDYPDTGLDPNRMYDGEKRWWQLGMHSFTNQVRKHCFDCGVPLRGYGALAQGQETQVEQTSATHASVYRPKRTSRKVEVVTDLLQLGIGKIQKSTHYIQNARV